MEQFERTALLLSDAAIKRLGQSGVVIFGLGGVGGQLAESLARAGVGRFLLIDHDKIGQSNINRQIVALHSTVGKLKTEVMKARILDINPVALVETQPLFITAENIETVDFNGYNVVCDAVDTVAAKIEIIKKAKNNQKQIVTCMGAGNRLDINFLTADIHSTYGCPLAKSVRIQLKKLEINDVTAVFAPVASIKNNEISCINNTATVGQNEKRPIGSVPFVPPAAGLHMAREVVKIILCAGRG